MSDTDTGDPVTEVQPGDPAEVQDDNEPSELEQKLAAAETRIAELADAETRADKYARALFEARVAATGRLADPTDLPFAAELVDDADKLTAAIDALLASKPHFRSRKPSGADVGQGQTGAATGEPSWSELLFRKQ